jgi:hypothetical protein
MPKTDEPGRQVKGTLRGYHLWAFDLVRDDQDGESGAIDYIVARWLAVNRSEALAEFEISRDNHRRWKEAKGRSDGR